MGPDPMTGVLTGRGKGQVQTQEKYVNGAETGGTAGATWSWGRQEGPSLELPEGAQPCPALISDLRPLRQ